MWSKHTGKIEGPLYCPALGRVNNTRITVFWSLLKLGNVFRHYILAVRSHNNLDSHVFTHNVDISHTEVGGQFSVTWKLCLQVSTFSFCNHKARDDLGW